MPRSPVRMLEQALQEIDENPDSDHSPTHHITESVKQRAKREAHRQADTAKSEFGRRLFDLVEQHFPEEAKSRRKRSQVPAFLVGIGIGILLRQYLSR